MQVKNFLLLLFLCALVSCAYTQSTEKKDEIYAPVEASICHLNQKVASYFLTTEIPDDFNETQYKKVVEEVCNRNSSCQVQAQTVFDSYAISVRKISDMFSVMICDKEMKWKIMEDFSCNNMRVEIQNWKNDVKIPCKYEENWERVKKENCDD